MFLVQGVLLLTGSLGLLSYLSCATFSMRCLRSPAITKEVSIASLISSYISGHAAILPILDIIYFGLKVKSKNRKDMKREVKASV